eukprot:NODE_866_length_3409_cov_0.418731.p3 type:complete len:303 gc:universal NODE_866_length_3409_cov_0.418731:2125-1217(-)
MSSFFMFVIIISAKVIIQNIELNRNLSDYTSIEHSKNEKDDCITEIYYKEKLAIKRVCGSNSNKKCGRNVERELNMLADLSHPNIIKINSYDKFINNTITCFYMEMPYYEMDFLTRAEELRNSYINQQFEEELETVFQKMSKDILNALNYLHKQGKAHFDIKPENIVYSRNEDKYLLIDFDKSTKAKTKYGLHGTLQYFSPEMRSQTLYSPRKSDLFSFGATLVRCVGSFVAIPDLDQKKIVPCEHPFFNESHTPFTDEFMKFIAEFIKCDPNDRMTAQQALEHPFITGEPFAQSEKRQRIS